MDALYSYIIEVFSTEPNPKDIIECCRAMLQLFPYLKTNPSNIEGIVSGTYFFAIEQLLTVLIFIRMFYTTLQ